MKKISMICALLLSVFLLVSCAAEKHNGRYGGTDVNGLSADSIVNKCYEYFETDNIEKAENLSSKENLFSEKTELVSLNECFVVEDYKPDELEEWYKDVYAYCVVQTSSEIYCKEDCVYGSKGDTITLNYAYYLIMKDETSPWVISDFGYPPASDVVLSDVAE